MHYCRENKYIQEPTDISPNAEPGQFSKKNLFNFLYNTNYILSSYLRNNSAIRGC